MTRDEEWRPINLLQPIANVILAATFEWGIALHDLEAQQKREGVDPMQGTRRPTNSSRSRSSDRSARILCCFRPHGPGVEAHADRERDRESRAESVGIRGDLLRALPGRRREVHRRAVRDRDTRAVVPAPDARQCQHRRRPDHGIPHRKSQLPDRAPPVPGPAVEPVLRDRRAGAGAVHPIRPAIYDGTLDQAIPADVRTIHSCACQTASSSAPPTTLPRPRRNANSTRMVRESRGRCESTPPPGAGAGCCRLCVHRRRPASKRAGFMRGRRSKPAGLPIPRASRTVGTVPGAPSLPRRSLRTRPPLGDRIPESAGHIRRRGYGPTTFSRRGIPTDWNRSLRAVPTDRRTLVEQHA